MHRICGMDVKLTDQEYKYYSKVFKYAGFIPLITIFLLGVVSVSGLVPVNYLMAVIAIIFTVYFLYTIKLDSVGTKQHLRAGIILAGSYLFYSFSSYTVTLSVIIGFTVFITYINGRELQLRRKEKYQKKVTSKR